MFEYMTAQEATECWKISVRQVQRLCKENRIKGVLNINRVWLILKEAKIPLRNVLLMTLRNEVK